MAAVNSIWSRVLGRSDVGGYCGAELFTGNNMFLTIAALNGETTWGKLLYIGW